MLLLAGMYVRLLLPVALVVTVFSSARADEVNPNTGRKTLVESAGDAPRVCTSPTCATVIAVKHLDLYEPPPLFGSARDPYPPSRFMVQQHKEFWVVEVRRQDGTVRSVRLTYPALFQVGDWVLIEGDQIRAP